ncbi:MAG: acylphosphatase [Candidatus Bathyarchaeia archaeon]
MKVRAHVLAKGRVQGVFFRVTTREEAKKRSIVGWIRNLSDGSVEAIFEGEKEKVKALIDFCRVGPPRARVITVNVTWEEVTGFYDSFRIR